jgi:hypothetical protein
MRRPGMTAIRWRRHIFVSEHVEASPLQIATIRPEQIADFRNIRPSSRHSITADIYSKS